MIEKTLTFSKNVSKEFKLSQIEIQKKLAKNALETAKSFLVITYKENSAETISGISSNHTIVMTGIDKEWAKEMYSKHAFNTLKLLFGGFNDKGNKE